MPAAFSCASLPANTKIDIPAMATVVAMSHCLVGFCRRATMEMTPVNNGADASAKTVPIAMPVERTPAKNAAAKRAIQDAAEAFKKQQAEATAAFQAKQAEDEKKEADAAAKRQSAADAADDLNKMQIKETLDQIEKLKGDLIILAKQANAQASMASQMASEAAKQSMASYVRNQKLGPVNNGSFKKITNSIPGVLAEAAKPNGRNPANVTLGGRRRKTRRAAKKRGTKRR
jgi:hypothetical protein